MLTIRDYPLQVRAVREAMEVFKSVSCEHAGSQNHSLTHAATRNLIFEMNSILNVSAPQLRRAASIKDQIDTLNAELTRLLGTPNDKNVPTGMRRMSVSARRKIAAAQKARWAKTKSAVVQGRRRKMSAAARKKIAEAAKARWAKAKAAGRTSL
jgi:hypothetical protein